MTTAVTDVSQYGQLSLNATECTTLKSGRANLVISASANGDATDANKTVATFVGGVASPSLTFTGTGNGPASGNVLIDGIREISSAATTDTLKFTSKISGSTVNYNSMTLNASTTTPTLTLAGTGTAGSTVQIKGVAAPTDGTDVANKTYVDNLAAGIDVKASVYLATAAVLDAVNVPTYINGTAGVGATLTEAVTTTGALTIDGVALTSADVGKRILVKTQASPVHNGFYTVTQVAGAPAAGAWQLTRATDADSAADFSLGAFTFVENGTANGGKGFVATGNAGAASPDFTVGTDSIVFSQFSQATALNFTLPLQNTAGTVALNRAGELGLDGSSNLIVSNVSAVAQGRMLVASANATTASAYSNRFGNTTSAEPLLVSGLAAAPAEGTETTITDASMGQGALNLQPDGSLGVGTRSAAMLLGPSAGKNTVAMYASTGATVHDSEFKILSHNSGANSWSVVAVFSKTTS